MPPRKIKVVDVINEAYNDNVLPDDVKAIEDIPEHTPQPVEEEVTQPVSNIKTVEFAECPDCKKKMTNNSVEVFSC